MVNSCGMSEEDVLVAKGRLLQNYTETNVRLQTLAAEAKRTGLVVGHLAEFLKSGGTSGSFSTGGNVTDIISVKVENLVADLNETRRRWDELRQALANMGVDFQH